MEKEKVYVFGHQKPDTDAVASAISAAFLMNQKYKEYEFVPRILGKVSKETDFILKKFNVDTPEFLNDVKLKVKNISYRKDFYIHEDNSIKDAYDFITEHSTSGVPIVDHNLTVKSVITLKDIAKLLMNLSTSLDTTMDNILKAINGRIVNKVDEKIVGNIFVTSYRSTTFKEKEVLKKEDIVITGDRHSIIEQAVTSKVKMLILTNGNYMKEEHLALAIKNDINVIKTDLSIFEVMQLLKLSNSLKSYKGNDVVCLYENDFSERIEELEKKYNYTNLPVIDKDDKCLGLLRYNETFEINKVKVLLVDHNEKNQSVEGLDEADIIEIIDHHKLGNVSTDKPINLRCMTLGSTCTVLYLMYKEQNINIPIDIKGIMLSAILSDTLCLKSPTTTKTDEEVVHTLAKELDINYEEYALEMFKEGSDLSDKDPEDIVTQDFKRFTMDDYLIGVGQVFVTGMDAIKEKQPFLKDALESVKKAGDFYATTLFVTDILTTTSYLYYTDSFKDELEKAFKIENLEQGYCLPEIVSRKKQIIPKIMEVYKK
ncbi:MAG: putative manganese-dependent inorganic diphosphatase [Clostridiales bacterium]|nr:putative manganese-dependent inorganic diphosphatase [Clostridiales bacterium]